MKSLLTYLVFAALGGIGLGALIAYFEVPPALDMSPEPAPAKTTAEAAKLSLQPKAEFVETVYEFGNIERGTSMSHAFKVRNTGGSPLQVEVTSTTCKCTVGDLANNVIPPNEESEILLEWTAKTPPGPFRHGAVISTSDPTQASVNLTVEGQVVESTAMNPSELIFGTVRVGESPTASLYLMQFLDEELEVTGHELSNQELAKQMEISIVAAEKSELPSPDAIRGLKVSATYKSGKTVGPFRSWLTITTNLKDAEKLTVPIAGNVVGDISIFGPGWNTRTGLLRMGNFTSNEGKSVPLKVAVRGEYNSESGFEVHQVDPPQLKATLGEPKRMTDKLTHVPLVVEVPAGTAPIVRLGEPASSDAQIVLRSKDGKTPDVTLRVRFAVE